VLRRVFKESLIVFGITLIFLLISATVGISTNTPPSSPTARAAHEREDALEEVILDRFPILKFEEEITSTEVD
jgi:hypothetical protein